MTNVVKFYQKVTPILKYSPFNIVLSGQLRKPLCTLELTGLDISSAPMWNEMKSAVLCGNSILHCTVGFSFVVPTNLNLFPEPLSEHVRRIKIPMNI